MRTNGHVLREVNVQNENDNRTELDSGKIRTRNAQLRVAAEYVVQAKLPGQRHFR